MVSRLIAVDFGGLLEVHNPDFLKRQLIMTQNASLVPPNI